MIALFSVLLTQRLGQAQAVAPPRASARGSGNGGARSSAPWVGLSGWVSQDLTKKHKRCDVISRVI